MGDNHVSQPDNRVWKSCVWHNSNCFFVSTIERTFDTYEGSIRGLETIVWEYDWEKRDRGRMLYQAGGLNDHQNICRQLIATGEYHDPEHC